jgi:DNA-binding NtrC family response regulator
MAWLTIITGASSGQRYELVGDRTTIGRDAVNAVQIADAKSSRVHAEIVRDGGRHVLRDLDSSNGTWSGNGRISSLPLSHGAQFRIGATHFRYDSIADQDAWADPTAIQGLGPQGTVLFTPSPTDDLAALTRANAYLVLLHHLILRSHEAGDREALFELLDDAAAEVLEGDRCAVFLPTGDGWSLWPAHERRLRARFGAVPFARTLLAAVRERREPLRCAGDGDLRPSQSMVQAGVQSAMAAPVRVGEDIHALLYVDRLSEAKPFNRTDLEFLVAVANQIAARLGSRAAVDALQAEVERLQQAPPAIGFIAEDSATVAVRRSAERFAAVNLPLLITGEPGTGKELLARFIHQHSVRAAGPFQVITGAGLDDASATMLLFGRGGGAGALELADGGTLFIDDLAQVPEALHARLLRVVESGEIQRPGEAALRRSEVRLIAAVDVRAPMGSSALWSAVAAQRLDLPPLRARGTDVILIAEHLLAQEAMRQQSPLKRFAPDARAALLRHPWPGNVRELRHVVLRACVTADGAVITQADLGLGGPSASTSGQAAIVSLAAVERAHILRVLEHCGGNKKAAAELLEIDRSTLYAKLRQYGMA